jgi:hypothetical protein
MEVLAPGRRPSFVDAEPPGDGRHPGPELPVRGKPLPRRPRPHEGVLRHRLGVAAGTEIAAAQPDHPGVVGAVEGVEAVGVDIGLMTFGDKHLSR